MPTYNKLVRDHIPEIIEQTGKAYKTVILTEAAYILELKKKAQEELKEYLESQNDEEAIEELADLLEVVHALAKVHGSSIEKIESIRQKKAETRGGFQDRIFLIDVDDE
ncbi:nucleoside triphosphate pyrophosphohydrolase [Metabacillus iocasae]|uniref:House-cleaning noncanonical NTP pyrophosphatase (MazG superfamily) n=1 Tax=Priestia iocasae TaxID=2291674 RepID=A0ABS2QWZ0_9BACI|nr:nucleoside triphosphate pyrophosphohydrolase [Metabacillus iocasae]MBM7703507.1 putative house-cleaning noncanonical NTP pyrophosphatase (MazG superfamily) [Metabacillus iocasae]